MFSQFPEIFLVVLKYQERQSLFLSRVCMVKTNHVTFNFVFLERFKKQCLQGYFLHLYLYINLACFGVWVSVCLFVSNKRQNG